MRSLLRTALVVAVGMSAACGAGPVTGDERGPCYGNHTCNDGLACLSDVCVRIPDAGVDAATDAPTDGSIDAPTGGSNDASSVDAPVDAVPIQVPDIDGLWLLAVNPSVAPGAYVQFRVTWNITAGASGGVLDGSYQPLRTFGLAPDSAARTPVGAPLVASATPVTDIATFAAHLVGTLPGDANPVSGTEYPLDITLQGRIVSDSSVCGTVIGIVGPLNLDGSSFGAVRATSMLPAPVATCP
jgi:hypothetical protein